MMKFQVAEYFRATRDGDEIVLVGKDVGEDEPEVLDRLTVEETHLLIGEMKKVIAALEEVL
jgi:hypothetical protein